jgi:hypothetical protein
MVKTLPRAIVHFSIQSPWFKIRILEFKRVLYLQVDRSDRTDGWDTVQTYKSIEHLKAYKHAVKISQNILTNIRYGALEKVDLQEIIVRNYDHLPVSESNEKGLPLPKPKGTMR